ncbi:hypothetical protein [Nocardia sp. CS682]|uniref:hypothetical protein n=1 Tax=Nocardia sp. CS682 TaxID=1047172 RepID=UPI001074A33A|nr:hypothetical protein [Nocardia sp. CS682]QBS40388.1 hypothetical protein DMB37_09935 [Nocardia sp. CS682]
MIPTTPAASGGDVNFRFERRQTAAATLVASAVCNEILDVAAKFTSNGAVDVLSHHGAFVVGALWLTFEMVLLGLDKRYKKGSSTSESTPTGRTYHRDLAKHDDGEDEGVRVRGPRGV